LWTDAALVVILELETRMTKRFADWLEKVSVAALAVGLFQNNGWGIVVATAALCGCMWLTKRLEGKQ
jgi:hypothetical protein